MKKLVFIVLMLFVFITACETEKKDDNGNESNQEILGDLQEITKEQAAVRAADNTENMIKNLSESLKFIEDSMFIQDIFDSIFIGEDQSDEMERPYDPREEPTENPEEWEEEPREEEYNSEFDEDENLEIEFDDFAESLREFLDENIFVEEQFESDDGTSIVYLLKPEIFCAAKEDEEDYNYETNSDNPNEGRPEVPRENSGNNADYEDNRDGENFTPENDPPEPENHMYNEGYNNYEEENQDCEKILTEIPIRLKFYSYNEGDVDIEVLVGEDKDVILHIQLYADLLAGDINLGNVKDFAEEVTRILEEDEEEVMPEILEGVIRAELKKENSNKFTAKLKIKEDLSIKVSDENKVYSIDVKPSEISISADSAAKILSASINIGELDAKGPYEDFVNSFYENAESCWGYYDEELNEYVEECDEVEEAPVVSGILNLLLSGLSSTVEFSADSESISFTEIGLGENTSKLNKDDTTLLAIDINKDTGRSFDFSFYKNEDENFAFKFNPEFNLSLMFLMESIMDDVKDLPSFMKNETLSFVLNGADEPEISILESENPEPENDTELESNMDNEPDKIKVEKGTLTISSTAAPSDTVTVEAGMCLYPEDEEDDETNNENNEEEQGHEILSHLISGSCSE